MKTILFATSLLSLTTLLLGADPAVFELRSVADVPGATTMPYLLPRRDGGTEKVNLDTTVLLDHTAVKSASVATMIDGRPGIYISLTDAGRERFGEITEKMIGKRLGVVVSGKLVIAPVIRMRISDATVALSGGLTEQEAADLAASINECVAKHAGSSEKNTQVR